MDEFRAMVNRKHEQAETCIKPEEDEEEHEEQIVVTTEVNETVDKTDRWKDKIEIYKVSFNISEKKKLKEIPILIGDQENHKIYDMNCKQFL